MGETPYVSFAEVGLVQVSKLRVSHQDWVSPNPTSVVVAIASTSSETNGVGKAQG